MNMKSKTEFFQLPVETPAGRFVAGYSERGLASLTFPDATLRPESMTQRIPAVPQQVEAWHRTTSQALARALAGKPVEELPPLDLSSGTDFQQRVWNVLRKISCGETRSYTEVAREIGRPEAVRAVGGACGANPIPVLVPCHRVLAANKKLGGFGGGLDWKRTLLAREGVSL